MSTTFRRRLIWVPIVHAQADLGTMSGPVREAYIRRMGKAKFERHVKMVDDMWRTIRQEIERLGLAREKVRLYQDGLPAGGHEVEIVRDLAQAGSPNHRLLADLAEKGATITGTESPDLLLEEYALARQMLASPAVARPPVPAARGKDLGQRLLDRRDAFIAQRIAQTLEAGETGLIFLGMLHSLAGRLPPDIEVILLRDAGRVLRPSRAARPKKRDA